MINTLLAAFFSASLWTKLSLLLTALTSVFPHASGLIEAAIGTAGVASGLAHSPPQAQSNAPPTTGAAPNEA